MADSKISISFKKKYVHVYHFLHQMKDKKENVSEYICKLVEMDMNTAHNLHSLEDVRKIVLEVFQANSHILINPPAQTSKKTSKEISDEDIKLLNQLF